MAAAAASRPRPANRPLETEKRLLLDSPTPAKAYPVGHLATPWPIFGFQPSWIPWRLLESALFIPQTRLAPSRLGGRPGARVRYP